MDTNRKWWIMKIATLLSCVLIVEDFVHNENRPNLTVVGRILCILNYRDRTNTKNATLGRNQTLWSTWARFSWNNTQSTSVHFTIVKDQLTSQPCLKDRWVCFKTLGQNFFFYKQLTKLLKIFFTATTQLVLYYSLANFGHVMLQKLAKYNRRYHFERPSD